MALVDADALADRGKSRDAEDWLPELLLRLVEASATTRRKIEGFRTGRGTSMGDYDGYTDVLSENEYLPNGIGVWEWSTDQRIEWKASDDYKKRTLNPGRVDKKHVTYVAVTSRRWDKGNWEGDRNAEGEWLEVKTLDIGAVFRWLLQNNSVHIWLSERLNQ